MLKLITKKRWGTCIRGIDTVGLACCVKNVNDLIIIHSIQMQMVLVFKPFIQKQSHSTISNGHRIITWE